MNAYWISEIFYTCGRIDWEILISGVNVALDALLLVKKKEKEQFTLIKEYVFIYKLTEIQWKCIKRKRKCIKRK